MSKSSILLFIKHPLRVTSIKTVGADPSEPCPVRPRRDVYTTRHAMPRHDATPDVEGGASPGSWLMAHGSWLLAPAGRRCQQKNHPCLHFGTSFPSPSQFSCALRRYAIPTAGLLQLTVVLHRD